MSGDFLIIGGGIAGVSAAARLSHLGQVALIEGETALGYHTSGRSAAMFEESYGKPSVRALNRASRAYHETANGGVLSDRGFLMLGAPGNDAAMRAECRDYALEELTATEAKALVPILRTEAIGLCGLSWAAKDIDTDRLIQNFVREARGNGATVTLDARADAIARTDAGWAVQTARGTFEARILVNAAGAWIDQIASMAWVRPLGFQPYRRSMARLPAPGGHDLTKWPMIMGAGETWYAKPDAGKLLVSPAEEHPMEPHDAWADDMVLAEGIARYQDHVTEEVTRIETSWAGLRTFAPDRTLVIGFDPEVEDFFWLGGQGGYGMQTAPAASQLVADLIAGRPPELGADIAREFDPARLR